MSVGRLRYYVTLSAIRPVVSPVTLILVTPPANSRVLIYGVDISCSLQNDAGSAYDPATVPVQFDFGVVSAENTTDQTFAVGTNIHKVDRGWTDAPLAAIKGYNGGGSPTEPTLLSTISVMTVHRLGQLPERPRFPIVVNGGVGVAFRYTGPTDADDDLSITMYCEE